MERDPFFRVARHVLLPVWMRPNSRTRTRNWLQKKQAAHLEFFVQFTAVPIQHRQVQWTKVCIKAAKRQMKHGHQSRNSCQLGLLPLLTDFLFYFIFIKRKSVFRAQVLLCVRGKRRVFSTPKLGSVFSRRASFLVVDDCGKSSFLQLQRRPHTLVTKRNGERTGWNGPKQPFLNKAACQHRGQVAF